MTEQEFLNELKKALAGLPEEEQNDILQDIGEYFINGRQDGKPDSAIAAELGTPSAIAAELLAFSPAAKSAVPSSTETDDEFDDILTEMDNASLEIGRSPDGKLHVDVREKSYRQQLTTDITNRTLVVTLKEEPRKFGLFNFTFNTKSPVVRILLPEKSYGRMILATDNGRIEAQDLAAQSIRMKSSNGRIQGDQLTAERLSAESDNGRISLKDVSAGELTAESDNGRVELHKVSALQVKAKSSNGRIELEDVAGSVEAESDNGRISLLTDDFERNIRLKTANGSITVQTAAEPSNTELRIKTGWGKALVFGEKLSHAVYGAGEHALCLRSGNGSITVEKN